MKGGIFPWTTFWQLLCGLLSLYCWKAERCRTALSGTGDSQRDSRESIRANRVAIETLFFIAHHADSHESLEFPIRANRVIRANCANRFARITPLRNCKLKKFSVFREIVCFSNGHIERLPPLPHRHSGFCSVPRWIFWLKFSEPVFRWHLLFLLQKNTHRKFGEKFGEKIR